MNDKEFIAWMVACGFGINSMLNRFLDRLEHANSSALAGMCIAFLILVWNVRKLTNVLTSQSRTVQTNPPSPPTTNEATPPQ